MNEMLRRKIKAHVKRTGIKSFGYQSQGLDIFTLQELIELTQHGLIDDIEVSRRRMKEGILNNNTLRLGRNMLHKKA